MIMIELWPSLGKFGAWIMGIMTELTLLRRYSIAVIGGPTVGPLVGSAITESYLGVSFPCFVPHRAFQISDFENRLGAARDYGR